MKTWLPQHDSVCGSPLTRNSAAAGHWSDVLRGELRCPHDGRERRRKRRILRSESTPLCFLSHSRRLKHVKHTSASLYFIPAHRQRGSSPKWELEDGREAEKGGGALQCITPSLSLSPPHRGRAKLHWRDSSVHGFKFRPERDAMPPRR